MPLIDPNKNPVGVHQRLQGETNPEYRRMLEEVRFHIAVEAGCDIESAIKRLSPTKAEYVLYNHATSPVTISGIDAIRNDFYGNLVATIDPRLEWDMVRCMVEGRTVITEGRQRNAVRGSALIRFGIEGADPEAMYYQEARHLVIWPFDEELRLIGETVYYGFSTPLPEVVKHPLKPEDIGNYSGSRYDIA